MDRDSSAFDDNDGIYNRLWAQCAQSLAERAKLGMPGYVQAVMNPAPRLSGERIVVVCDGLTDEYDTIEEAQAAAESLTADRGKPAYILKPFRRVSVKRETETVDL